MAHGSRSTIHPAETHPDVILYGIASRDASSVTKAAKKYHFTKAYGSYQELLDESAVNIVYISTPNGQHYEWTSMRSLLSDIAQVAPAMDMTYALSFTRYAIRAQQPKTINPVTARLSSDDQRVDAAMYAYLTFIGPQNTEVHSQIYTDMEREWIGSFVPRFWELPSIEVETERAIIFFYNAMMPHLYH
ncbi:hypothetical protein BDV23DRAFT_80603 [Aspergillus alliaceus]|uniref:D-xylose 1-dehydrogenase (NADP(+), D-xylono-1,5-lactone-forming) n=1 Tax=Petromyces alliaceus TaxID=209559 RepID=A0A5N7CNG6_PETAA|nr:hypothetical protein BDV23DRAFT_80603 [Aspergillus alliaceus]